MGIKDLISDTYILLTREKIFSKKHADSSNW